MKRVATAVIVMLSLWCVFGRAQSDTLRAPRPAAVQNRPSTPAVNPGRPQSDTKRIVDFEADQMRPIKLPGDSTALSLQGKVVFYHNGTVIQCDSAVRYSDKRMECFDNVVINKDETYVYGDRADYDGVRNIARVYAPIVKIVDGDVVMYTYNFSFNTLTNIGEFWGRGTVRQKDNLLESQRGYYYSEERRAVCVQDAELRNEEYRMRSDSLSYDMNTEQAEFYVLSYIWNQGGEILSAGHGTYVKADSAYRFTRDAYLINEDQELWSDTLHYNSRTEDAELWSNIQIRDEEHSLISFGDYGLYWGEREEAMLTRDPQVLSFDTEQKEDTLYMRSDSMFLYTVSREAGEQVRQIAEGSADERLLAAAAGEAGEQTTAAAAEGDTLAREGSETIEPAPPSPQSDSLARDRRTIVADSTDAELADSLVTPADSLAAPADSLLAVADTLTAKELRDLEKERKKVERDSLIMERSREFRARTKAREAEIKAREDAREAERLARERARDSIRMEKLRLKGKDIPEELAHALDHDHDHAGHAPHTDSLDSKAAAADSLAAMARADSVLTAGKQATDSLLTHGNTGQQDSMVRVVRAYRDVRIFRSDFQAVCDSLVAFSIDSTAHMYIDPVMWNGLNQIKSDVIDLYSKNQQLTKAVYTGTPIMSSEVTPSRYNQVKGLTITALFRDNDIYRTDVDGNGQTLYYMTEEDTLGHVEVMGFLVAECAGISFDIHEQQVTRIVYRGNPVYSIYPMDKIPEDQPRTLPGFVWEIERKPTKEEVFTRSIRPSQRESYTAMPEPAFPITDQISKHRERMIKDGVWRERNDVLGEHALLFIRSLGH